MPNGSTRASAPSCTSWRSARSGTAARSTIRSRERWLDRLGPETAVARARAFLAVPRPVARLNPRRPGAASRLSGLDPTPLAVPGALALIAPPPAAAVAEGEVYLQDEGSQLVAHL